MMSRTALAMLTLLLASCGGRPETKQYFTKVTELPLCESATVRNVNADAPDRSPGFDSIYIVDVMMPETEACYGPFLTAVEARLNTPCAPIAGCSGISSNGEFYEVHTIRGGFRVTHST
jgi:hypothetical protein